MSINRSKTELLIVGDHELVKQYQALDGQSRPWKIYTAPVWAHDGDPCLVTELIYQSPTSTDLKGKKEGYALWDSSFVPDSNFTVLDVDSQSKTDLLIMKENEMVKEYQELDGQNRPSKIYTAPVDAVQGQKCLVTEYIYQNPTSSVFKGKKESYSTWDTSWVPDSAFTVSV
jgi:hypothetical protein